MNSFREMLPNTVSLKCSPIADFSDELSQSEFQIIKNAISKRKAEFSTGRQLAKAAIRDLGATVGEILQGEQRQPLWPGNIVGSISHSSGICVAAAARTADISYIGIDIEAVHDVPEGILPTIASEEELQSLEGILPTKELAATLFCIREAVFKSYFPLTGHFLCYKDVRVELHEDAFVAKIIAGQTHTLFQENEIGGKVRICSGMAIATVAQA